MIFENRIVQYPNRKQLNIISITRDINGEITNMVVEEIDVEGEVYQNGTPLDERTLNLMINKFYYQKEEISFIQLQAKTQLITIEVELPTTLELNYDSDYVSCSSVTYSSNSCSFYISCNTSMSVPGTGTINQNVIVTLKKQGTNDIIGILPIAYTFTYQSGSIGD